MIILVDPDARFQARVAEQLNRGSDLVPVDTLDRLESAMIRAGRVDALIFGPNLDPEEAFSTARKLQTTQADLSVLLISQSLGADIFQRALRSGVRDVLPSSFTAAQLVEAVNRAEELAGEIRGSVTSAIATTQPVADHKVITVFSSKGGCGKSFVASNLAVAIAQRTGDDVALLDLDLQFGDLAIMLQLFPARTIFDAAQNLDRLDAEAIKGYMTPHRQKVALLAAPLEPGLSETISADAVARIIKLMKESYKWVVIDSPPSFTDHVLAALDQSDECVLMTSMDVPSIKNMKLSLQTLQLLGFGRDRIRLVLNRADSKVGLTVQAVEKTLGTTVDVSIPSSRDVSVSINRGTPLVIDNPKSPVVASIYKMLEILGAGPAGPVEEAPEPNQHKRFGFRKNKELGRSES
ncbi:MAG TPA: P-loop NTPase [Actinomycetota bacterium]|nr:P-loop NTPase [Actinomycetota bacterium]